MKRRVTQADIAKAVGVGQTTVALVVGGSNSPLRQRLSPETIRRVQEKAAELGYLPNRSAQIMRTGRSNVIAVLNFGRESELTAKRSYHLGRLVHEAGYDYQVIDAYWWVGDAQRIVDQVIGLRPEGVILSGVLQAPFGEAHLEQLFKEGIPAVAVSSSPMSGLARIGSDSAAAFYELTRHCIGQGRRRLALVLRSKPGKNQGRQYEQRLSGFRRAVIEARGAAPEIRTTLEFKRMRRVRGLGAIVISHPEGRTSFEPFRDGMQIMEAIAEWPERPDALVCVNDDYAIGALTICTRRGIAVPGELSISGFDNLVYTSQGGVPLTTVEQPIEKLCSIAVEQLEAQIQARRRGETPPRAPEAVETLVPCEIVWRESTGAPAIPEPEPPRRAARS